MDYQRAERISLFKGFGQSAGKEQYILLADIGVKAGGQLSGSGYIDKFPIGLRRQVHLAVRGLEPVSYTHLIQVKTSLEYATDTVINVYNPVDSLQEKLRAVA